MTRYDLFTINCYLGYLFSSDILSWIRTNIGIMAFGFVVEKFALFIKQMAYVLGKSTLGESLASVHDGSHVY